MARKKARDRKRQTQINFSPAAKSSPAAGPSSLPSVDSPSRSAPNKTAPIMSTRSRRARRDSSSEDDRAAVTEDSSRLGMSVKSAPRGMSGTSNVGIVMPSSSEEGEKESEERVIANPATRKRRRATLGSASDEHEATATVLPRKRQRRPAIKVEISEDEDESTRPKGRSTKRHETPDEDIHVQLPPRSARRRTTKARSPSTEDFEEKQTPRLRRLTRRRPLSDEEALEHTPPRSTRRRRVIEVPSQEEDDLEDNNTSGDEVENEDQIEEVDDEQDELKEDLDFLRSSPLPDRGRLRSTHEKPKNKRQEALEALKRRRAGTNEPSSSVTPSRSRKTVVIESDSDLELEVIKEEQEDSDLENLDDVEDYNEDEQSDDRDANALDMFQEDHEDENFIDDDPDAQIGEPSVTADLDDMRLAFSLSRAKPKELFKHVVEWMVMKKIHPGFNSMSNIYILTFRKLDDEVKGLAGSKFTSSAWTPDFTKAMRARPDIIINEISKNQKAFSSDYCQACNRKNHPATFEVMLTGQPYDAETLEPLASDDTDSDSSDTDTDSELSADSEALLNGEKPAYNAAGERLPSEKHVFSLGSTCKANAHVAHTLHHWRSHLYSWVKDYLAREGHLTAEKLVQRDNWSDRKREKAAIKIVDQMEESKEIRKLYKLYKEQVAFALEASNEYKDGWGRR